MSAAPPPQLPLEGRSTSSQPPRSRLQCASPACGSHQHLGRCCCEKAGRPWMCWTEQAIRRCRLWMVCSKLAITQRHTSMPSIVLLLIEMVINVLAMPPVCKQICGINWQSLFLKGTAWQSADSTHFRTTRAFTRDDTLDDKHERRDAAAKQPPDHGSCLRVEHGLDLQDRRPTERAHKQGS